MYFIYILKIVALLQCILVDVGRVTWICTEVQMTLVRAYLAVCFVAEKYAQVQQNPILPPATLFLRGKNAEKVSARPPN